MIGTVGFGAVLFAASCFDVLRLRIPQRDSGGSDRAVRIPDPGRAQHSGPLDHLLAIALALLILLPLFALNMLGGGDVKLLVAVALWLGMNKLAALLILVGIVGGIFALFWLPMRWLIRTGLRDRKLPQSLQAHAPLPFALPIMIVAVLLFETG
jgi:Flp pilus assembly protein protease CpaA